MRSAGNRGFTLIELLTVIGIIALLLAILFPVFSRAREQARQTTCIANMHDIYVACNMYRQDSEAYPPLLLGLPENADGSHWLGGGSAPVPAGRIQRGYLFPTYVRNIEQFHCPDSIVDDQTTIVNAVFPSSAGFVGNATFGTHGIDIGEPATPIPYYAYDSYDISPSLSQEGVYEVVYSRDWTNAEGRGVDTQEDHPNQMKYPNPPADQTILTWCNNHVLSGSDKCPVMLLSGTARLASPKDLQERGWNWAGR